MSDTTGWAASATHVYPVAIEHDIDGPECWCEPRIETVTTDSGEVRRIIVHRGPPDSDDESMQ